MPRINFMRVLAVICTISLSAATALSYVSAQTSHIEDSVLRLHIVANSDTVQDQELKLKIRDAIIESCGFLFKDCTTAEQSAKIAQDNIGFIKYTAKEVISRNGFNYPVTCEVTKCSFPTKRYDMISGSTLALPCGYYNAVNIRIGDACGQNWWCVMYPPLCFVDGVAAASENAEDTLKSALSKSEYELITNSDTPSVQIKFKIAEILGKH